MTDTIAAAAAGDGGPDPKDRRRAPDAAGTPLRAGGQDWLLADAVPEPGPVWDRLFDANVLRGRYDLEDLRLAAFRLLRANYHLTPDEAVSLVLTVRPAELVAPVETALYGPDREYRGYTDWVRSSLLANGIDPGRVPPRDLRAVLAQLVATGRAVPAEAFVSSTAAASKRRKLLEQL